MWSADSTPGQILDLIKAPSPGEFCYFGERTLAFTMPFKKMVPKVRSTNWVRAKTIIMMD
jgi:hypothetical protein